MNHKRLTAAIFGAAIAAASLTADPAAAAPLRPAAIAGDSHSSTVATHAAETLASFDALTRAGGTTRLIRYIGDRNATADAVAAEFGIDAGAVRLGVVPCRSPAPDRGARRALAARRRVPLEHVRAGVSGSTALG